MEIWVNTGRNLMDNLGKNWLLINTLFCGYQRRSEIHYAPKMHAETYTRVGTGAPAGNDR